MSPAAAPLPAEQFARLLEKASAGIEPPVSPAALSGLATYLAELDRWRRRVNLTGDLSPEDLVEHALESLAGRSLIPHGARVIDIGSGGGFPAVPLAIVRPDIRMTMLEPRARRAAFLRHVCRSLALEGAQVLESRVEDLESPAWSVATTRAVGELGRLVGAARFLERPGLLLAWTTEPEGIAEQLASHFVLHRVEPHSGAGRRVLAVLRTR
ncbi:MAG: 16S rRNA (guanine(527)-N(7))-methyltransferase RsmG [Acidobacteriota bacterium]